MNDFFRGLWWLSLDYPFLGQAKMNLYSADLTIHPLNLDGLSDEQADFLERRWQREGSKSIHACWHGDSDE